MVNYFVFRLLQYFWEESYILRVTYFLSVFILLAISSGATSNCPNNCVSDVGNDMISSLANTELECSLIHRPLTIPVLLYSQNFPPVVQPYLEHSPYFLHERHFSINCLPVSSHYVTMLSLNLDALVPLFCRKVPAAFVPVRISPVKLLSSH